MKDNLLGHTVVHTNLRTPHSLGVQQQVEPVRVVLNVLRMKIYTCSTSSPQHQKCHKPLADDEGRSLPAELWCAPPNFLLVDRSIIFGVNLQLVEIQHVCQLEHIPIRMLWQSACLNAHPWNQPAA